MKPLILTNLILTIMANNLKNDRVAGNLDQATIDKIVEELLNKQKRDGVLPQKDIDKILADHGLRNNKEVIDAIIATIKLMEQNNPRRETVSEGIKILKKMQEMNK